MVFGTIVIAGFDIPASQLGMAAKPKNEVPKMEMFQKVSKKEDFEMFKDDIKLYVDTLVNKNDKKKS